MADGILKLAFLSNNKKCIYIYKVMSTIAKRIFNFHYNFYLWL